MHKTLPASEMSMDRNGVARDIRSKFLGDKPAESSGPSMRVVLYSHDTMGIGHMRRNLLIAKQLKQKYPQASILVIAGAREAAVFSQVQNIDCLTLPSFKKMQEGVYQSRHLGIPAGEVLDFRSETILAAIKSYQPDLLIVDKIPQGAGGELLPALSWLSAFTDCRTVLGLREILDDPETVMREWKNAHTFEIIRAYFDSIWIYGDAQVFDASREYQFPKDILNRVEFTGYLDTRGRLDCHSADEIQRRPGYVLCTLGGGQDGESLALNFVEAARRVTQRCILLTGPYMPSPALQEITDKASQIPHLEVLRFVSEADLLVKHACQVVSMGGYNTVSAILSWNKPAMIVPRVLPRSEQLIRASRLSDLGHISMLHPNQVTPDRLAHWIANAATQDRTPARSIDFGGLNRICELVGIHFPVQNTSSGVTK